jgi:hypothetical protein
MGHVIFVMTDPTPCSWAPSRRHCIPDPEVEATRTALGLEGSGNADARQLCRAGVVRLLHHVSYRH